MVKILNFSTAVNGPFLRGLTSTSPSLIHSLDALNTGWGFTPDAFGAQPGSRFRLEGGQVMIGNITLDVFNSMSLTQKVDFFNDPTVFDGAVRTKISNAIDGNFVDPSTRARSLEMGRSSLEKTEADLRVNGQAGTVNTASVKWTTLMGKLSKVALHGAAALWTLNKLNELVESNSGCFMEGPNGESMRMGGRDSFCGCAETDTTGAINALRQACCTKCKISGDTALICPTDSPSDMWTDPYVCPADPLSGAQVRLGKKSRSSISAYAAAAQKRAETLALAQRQASTAVLSGTTEVDTCTSCGCSTEAGEWKLCMREASVWSVIGGIVADAGMMIVEGLDGLPDIVSALLGALAGPIKMVLTVVGVAVGAAIVVGASIMIARAAKKKKRAKLR